MRVKIESEVTQSCPTLSDPMYCSLLALPSMGFSRQKYWSGVPLPSQSILPKEENEEKRGLMDLEKVKRSKNQRISLSPCNRLKGILLKFIC